MNQLLHGVKATTVATSANAKIAMASKLPKGRIVGGTSKKAIITHGLDETNKVIGQVTTRSNKSTKSTFSVVLDALLNYILAFNLTRTLYCPGNSSMLAVHFLLLNVSKDQY